MKIISSFFNERILVGTGDITTLKVDAIVNAANSSLMGGGGVDGAIHRAAGPELLAACKNIRATLYPQGLPTGQAVLTGAFRLPARYVIHTVGPVFGQDSAERSSALLADCYTNCLCIATQQDFRSLAFPAISTGIYGFPKELAAKVTYKAVSDYLFKETRPEKVYLVFFSESDARIFLESIEQA
jgi:O-acetyl-ADP-ribose deacetylase (regulator of RNase III)